MLMTTFLIFVRLLCVVEAHKILCVAPIAGHSHFEVFFPLLKGLSERGHEVTVISYFPRATKIANYTDISLQHGEERTSGIINFETFEYSRLGRLFHLRRVDPLSEMTYEKFFASKQLRAFLSKPQNFDLVLFEPFPSACALGILRQIRAPLVALSSSVLLTWIPDYFGQPDNPSYIPTALSDFSDRMGFADRIENLLAYVIDRYIYKYVIDARANRMAKEFFGEDLPPLDEFLFNASLILMNSHHAYHSPKPLVPSVIEVGGMHIGKPKNLPMNIEKWIRESPHGVIYFSMGSMIKGDTFPEEKREMFLRAFGRLRQRVLWKWENDTMPGKPDNVMIQKWMPQFDILCHPNVKAFISHGGLLGTTEAVHCGVPVVVMPQYGDQYTNARALEASGGGIILRFSTATEEDVYNALKTVLDPSSNRKAKELSERFRDRPMSPLDTAIYWVEYVARHKGAHHLRTAAVGMPLYQYLLLDVIGFLILVTSVVLYVTYYVTRAVFRKLFGSKAKVKTN